MTGKQMQKKIGRVNDRGQTALAAAVFYVLLRQLSGNRPFKVHGAQAEARRHGGRRAEWLSDLDRAVS